VITPYCPITSDGKEPDLSAFGRAITAMRKAQRAAPNREKKVSQKDVVLDHLDDAVAAASGDGGYPFNGRSFITSARSCWRKPGGSWN
jgi:hypothetical protein